MFRFKCTWCGAWHEGMPTLGADAPAYFYSVPEDERERRCVLGTDACVIDDEHFFVRGCLEIPVHAEADPFVWGVWISLSNASFEQFLGSFEEAQRSHLGPFFGWLSSDLPLYPKTMNLKARAHLRDDGLRPYIELEPTDHPLATEQRDGIAVDRVVELYAHCESGQAAHPTHPE